MLQKLLFCTTEPQTLLTTGGSLHLFSFHHLLSSFWVAPVRALFFVARKLQNFGESTASQLSPIPVTATSGSFGRAIRRRAEMGWVL